MPLYSNSRLSTFENCPHQYKLRYIDRIKPPESAEGIEAFLGSRVHDVLEKLHKELILSKLNSLDDLISYYYALWDKNWHKNVSIVKKDFTKKNYRDSGKAAITSYYKRYHPFDQAKTLATEQLVTFKIGDHSMQGYIDRLSYSKDGYYEIHDYKSSGSLPPQEKFDNDRQLALYQIGVREKYKDAKNIRLIWHYVLFDKEISSLRSEAQLKDLKKQVISLIKNIEKETAFNPNESNLCNWCAFPEYCVAKKHELKVRDLPKNKYLKDKGVTLVNKYAELKTKIKELRDQEKELADELDLIEEAAIEYAHKKNITNIDGRNFTLNILDETALSFPRSGKEGRENLEEIVKKAKIWENVSTLNIRKLANMVNESQFDKRTISKLLKYAEEIEEVKVKLVKKNNDL